MLLRDLPFSNSPLDDTKFTCVTLDFPNYLLVKKRNAGGWIFQHIDFETSNIISENTTDEEVAAQAVLDHYRREFGASNVVSGS